MSVLEIYLPQGWTHFMIGIPLPIRAGKNIQNALEQLGQHFTFLQILPVNMMMVKIEDLGLCPIENHEAIQIAIKRIMNRHTQFKLVAKRWVLESHEDHVSIWLELKDRFGQFSDLQKDIQYTLQKYGFDLNTIDKPKVLCAKGKLKGSKDLPNPVRMQMWAHEINIYQRPQVYTPLKGYECVTSFALATERTDPLEDDDLDYMDLDSTKQKTQEDSLRESQLLEKLEARLVEHHQNQQKYKNKPRKRLPRRRKHSSKKEKR